MERCSMLLSFLLPSFPQSPLLISPFSLLRAPLSLDTLLNIHSGPSHSVLWVIVTSYLHPRLLSSSLQYPTAYLSSLLTCLMDYSKLTCSKLSQSLASCPKLSPGAFPSQLMETPFFQFWVPASFSHTPGNPVGSSYKIRPLPTFSKASPWN